VRTHKWDYHGAATEQMQKAQHQFALMPGHNLPPGAKATHREVGTEVRQIVVRANHGWDDRR